MPVYRATNERGALALGLASEPDDREGCDAVIRWGPFGGGLPGTAEFVAACDILPRPEHGVAEVVLPALGVAERQGSYVNLEGRVQFLRPVLAVSPPLREGWEVLCEIGQRFGMAEMERYAGIRQVQRAAAEASPALAALAAPPEDEAMPGPVLYCAARP